MCICVWTSVCVCVSVHMRVCGHLSVYACVWTSVCMRVCGHLCVCARVCVRLRVNMYVQVWTLLFCNVNVYHFHSYHYCLIWHGYTIHNDVESMVLLFKFHAGL